MVEEQTSQRQERDSRRVKVKQAVVVADNRDKTIKVTTELLVKHPRYGKYIRQRTMMHVHDEQNEAHVGDTVEIIQCRPLSKSKNWRLVKVIRKSRL